MYSTKHVLWRGAMALSLLVVGGVGAGVSNPQPVESDIACQEEAAYVFDGVQATVHPAIATVQITTNAEALPVTLLDTVVVQAIHTDA
jgi:hypothetical protein